MKTQGETYNANTHVESNGVPPPPMTATATQDQIEANDASNKVQQVGRKRKLTSPCWNHFKKIIVSVEEQKKADGTPSSFLSNYTFNEDTSRRNLAEMIIVHEYLLLMVEHHGFWKFLKGLQSLFRVPCRNTVKSDIFKIYDFEKKKQLGSLGRLKSATPKREQKFEEAVRQLEISTTKQLALDCKTRWNSTYLMLSVVVLYKDVFRRLKARNSQYKCFPKEQDWELAMEVCDRLQVFYEITLTFSGSKYPTANVFFASVCEIGYSLREWAGSSAEVIQKMASKMLENFNKYWSVISGVMGMAAILDPRYKLKFLELLLPKIYGQEKASIEIKTLEEFVKSLFKEYESTAPCLKVKESNGPRAGFKKLFSGIATIANQHDDSSGTTELDNYYNENPLPKDMKHDILMWWKTNGSKYPTLQRIAKDILAIPVSTVASESPFSTSGRLISPHRSRLHPKTLEALMCAQSWLLNEIRETCSEETEAYCRTVEFDYYVEE
ncbi:zinc finger BED domain-containing protein RICESLEEPER 2-like protein [Tanacetum coccineum]